MRILGLDSSTPQGSVALLHNQRILKQLSAQDAPVFSNQIPALVDRALAEAGWSLTEVDGFAVTTGPGSFTGLRVGISLIKGFVLATEKPFVAVSTFDAMAAALQTDMDAICPVLDARKQEVYATRFQRRNGQWVREMEDRVLAPQALCDLIDRPTLFVGSGVATYGALFRERLGNRCVIDPAAQLHCTAAGAALWAAQRFDDHKRYDLSSLHVHYIRKSEAELNFKG